MKKLTGLQYVSTVHISGRACTVRTVVRTYKRDRNIERLNNPQFRQISSVLNNINTHVKILVYVQFTACTYKTFGVWWIELITRYGQKIQ